MPNLPCPDILPTVMNTRIGAVILVVVCVGLGIALFATKRKASEEKAKDNDTIVTFSNQLFTVNDQIAEQRNVNVQLSGDLSNRNVQINVLTNQIAETTATLASTAETLKTAQAQIEKETARIAELESQNEVLDQRALNLSNTITNLNMAIEETQRKLNTAEGDRGFLEKELQRLMTEKAELERQFNDLAVLRSQVRKLKEELAISRRLEWIRKGILGEQKGAELMMQQNAQARTIKEETKKSYYNLNVEVDADGTIRLIPPLTNAPAGTNQ